MSTKVFREDDDEEMKKDEKSLNKNIFIEKISKNTRKLKS